MRTFGLLALIALSACDNDPVDGDEDGFTKDIDCDDKQADIFPGAAERCNAVDDDCDGDVDNDAVDVTPFYTDADGDGVGAIGAPSFACEVPADAATVDGDCNDADADVSPAADEVCDLVDNDCDTEVDEGSATDATTFYVDHDADGYGDASVKMTTCTLFHGWIAPNGWSEQDGDCDDLKAEVNPGMDEVCNDQLDNDCDRADDECQLLGDMGADDADRIVLGYPGEQLGRSVGAMDADTDGTADLIAGSFLGEGGYGTTYVTSWPHAQLTMATEADTFIEGTDASSFLGYRAVSGGDLNDDGFEDLVLMAPATTDEADMAEDADYTAYAGSALVFFGPLWHGDLDASMADIVITGRMSYSWLSRAALHSGDINGDGKDDLVLGAPADSTNGAVYGTVFAFFGPLEAGQVPASTADVIINGYITYGGLGTAVDLIEDVNGDGDKDLLIGVAAEHSGDGAAALFLSPLAAGVYDASDADVWFSDDVPSLFGASVAGGGDVDGDGENDVVIGAPWYGEQTDEGAYYVFGGPFAAGDQLETEDAVSVIEGAQTESYLGMTPPMIHDVNGDDVADLFLANPYVTGSNDASWAGAAWLIPGPLAAAVSPDDAAWSVTIDEPYAQLGASMAMGDVDGDGYLDLLLGSPGYSDLDDERGALLVFRGQGL